MQKSTTCGTRRGTRRRSKRSKAEWLELVNQWRSSGQSAVAFGGARDVHPGTLSVWASRFRHEASGQPARKSGKGSSLFLPVRVSSEQPQREVTSELAVDGGFEVVLTNGRRVRVAGTFRAESLVRLLAVVEGGASC